MIRRHIGHCDRKRRSRACPEPTTLSRKTCSGARERIREVVGSFSGRRRADPQRALQRRAPRAARREPRGGAARHAAARTRGRPLATRLRDNGRVLLARVSRHRRGDPRGARHHAGGRVAGRQLPRRRGADPRDPRRSSARLLPPAAQARGRAARRAIRASSAWPGPSSRTPTAASTRRRSAASCAPTSACSR